MSSEEEKNRVFVTKVRHDVLAEFARETNFTLTELNLLVKRFKTIRAQKKRGQRKATMSNLTKENSTINAGDFMEIIRSVFAKSMKPTTIERAFELFDADRSGTIDLAEFILGMVGRLPLLSGMSAVPCLFDI